MVQWLRLHTSIAGAAGSIPGRRCCVRKLGMEKSGRGVKINLNLWPFKGHSAISSVKKISPLIHYASTTFNAEWDKEAEKRHRGHGRDCKPLEGRRSLSLSPIFETFIEIIANSHAVTTIRFLVHFAQFLPKVTFCKPIV